MSSPARPNIILIMSDNQPAYMLGCYGNDEIKTPHIDRLAANGVRFDNVHCVNAMCSPCRASVLTGLMPSQHGIHNWLDDQLMRQWPDDWCAISEFNTLPHALKRAGYATALIGKYHLGQPYQPALGFDHWVTMATGHTTSFYDNQIIDGDQRYRHHGHTVDFFTDKTVEYLEGRKQTDDPFFAFIPYNGPYGHWPAIKGRAENQFARLYDDCPMTSAPREGLNPLVLDRFALRLAEGNGQVRDQFKGPLLLPNDMASLRNYYSQVSLVDHGVGRIVHALESTGQMDNTIIVYTSDHGFNLGHNGIWGHGQATWPSTLHRPSTHVPMVFGGGHTAVHGGKAAKGLMSQVDLFPTLLELADVDSRPSLQSDAVSQLNTLSGVPSARQAVFMEQEETRAIRTDKWLFMRRYNENAEFPLADALYDLVNDPEERHDCLSEHPEIAATLSKQLDAFFQDNSLPAHNLWQGGTAKSNVGFARFWQT